MRLVHRVVDWAVIGRNVRRKSFIGAKQLPDDAIAALACRTVPAPKVEAFAGRLD